MTCFQILQPFKHCHKLTMEGTQKHLLIEYLGIYMRFEIPTRARNNLRDEITIKPKLFQNYKIKQNCVIESSKYNSSFCIFLMALFSLQFIAFLPQIVNFHTDFMSKLPPSWSIIDIVSPVVVNIGSFQDVFVSLYRKRRCPT